MIAITRCYNFSASHRLHIDSLSESENEALYGKCNNPFGHGHNYRLEVSVVGPVHPLTGQLLPVERLDQLVRAEVLRRVDHRYLNVDMPEFSRFVPTTENLLQVVAGLLQQSWQAYIPAHLQLYRLQLQETGRNGFEAYFPVQPLHSAVPVQ